MKRTQSVFIARLFLLLALMIVIVGCSTNSNEKASINENDKVPTKEETTRKGGEAVIAYLSGMSNYDPIKGSGGTEHALLWPVFDTLINFTPELEPVPGLAESWDFPDDMTMVLTLREGVTFHDETPFNAEAVKYNLERVNSEDSLVPDLKSIESVEVMDEKTVKLNLSKPDSSILMALTDRGGMMVSPTAVKESGENFSRNPIGAGPYKMMKYEPDAEIIFEAYEGYWQEAQPHLDKLTIKIMRDENTRINALKSGEVDFAENITARNVANLESDSNIVLKETPILEFREIYLNASMAPLDNKAVRQAIMYAIDRQSIVEGINLNVGEVANQSYPKEYWAADKEMKIDYDPEKAKEILKTAGLEKVSFSMVHYPTAEETRIAEAIKSQLAEVGIEVDLQAMEGAAANASYFAEKKFPAMFSRWTGRPDPQMTVTNLFSSDSFYNAGGYSTPKIEELISEAGSVYDHDERANLYKEISKEAILEEAIVIPILFEPRISAMNHSLKGFEPNLLGKPLFSTIWMEE